MIYIATAKLGCNKDPILMCEIQGQTDTERLQRLQALLKANRMNTMAGQREGCLVSDHNTVYSVQEIGTEEDFANKLDSIREAEERLDREIEALNELIFTDP